MNMNGYECITTFWDDFTIAEIFGTKAILDTYDRVYDAWRSNYKYLTELSMVLNWKLWQHHKSNESYAELYDKLWREINEYAIENLDNEELVYYVQVTD